MKNDVEDAIIHAIDLSRLTEKLRADDERREALKAARYARRKEKLRLMRLAS